MNVSSCFLSRELIILYVWWWVGKEFNNLGVCWGFFVYLFLVFLVRPPKLNIILVIIDICTDQPNSCIMSFSEIQQSQGFSLQSSAKLISATATLLFVHFFCFFICPLKKPQGNQPYIIAGNTLSASTFCSWLL